MGQSWPQEEDAYLIFPMEYNGGAYIPVLPIQANGWIDVANLMHDHLVPKHVRINDIWPHLRADARNGSK